MLETKSHKNPDSPPQVVNLKFNSLSETLQNQASLHGSKTAFVELGEGQKQNFSIDYQTLDQKARAIGACLQEFTQPGDRVILLFPPGLDFVAALYGCFFAGVIAVPLYPPEPARLSQTLPRLELTAQDAEAKIILCNQRVHSKKFFLTLLAKGLRGFKWINTTKVSLERAPVYRPPSTKPDDLAVLMYTSGSTGNPKGVMLSHANILCDLQVYLQIAQEAGRPTPQDRGVIWAPPYHISGLMFGILFPVFLGSTNILLSPLDFLNNPIKWLQVISDYKASTSGGPTFGFDLCVAQAPTGNLQNLDLSSWDFAIIGAETIRPATIERFAETFKAYGFRRGSFNPAYGLTEAGMIISTSRPNQGPKILKFNKQHLEKHRVTLVCDDLTPARQITGCGIPMPHTQTLIVDPKTQKPCPPDRVGEIWVQSLSVAKGYWKRPKESQETFGGYLKESGEGPFLRTGDLGFFYEGELFLTGRIKEMIIIRGVNYYPQDIEMAVEDADPSFQQGAHAAFAMETPEGEGLVIVAECENTKKSQHKALIQKILKIISERFQIKPLGIALIKIGGNPRTASRKISRKKTRNQYLADELPVLTQWRRYSGTVGTSKQTASPIPLPTPKKAKDLASWLISTIAQALEVNPEEINPKQNFSHFGLDSLAAVEIARRIESSLGIPLTILKIFEAENIDEFIKVVERKWKEQKSLGQSGFAPLDLNREAVLDSNIDFSAPYLARSIPPQDIFLTGGTGFLGAFFLHRLLQKTQANIHCLVRASDEKSALLRLKENLDYFHLDSAGLEERVIPIIGDLSQERLGLDRTKFTKLAETVEVIYHFGAILNFIYSYWDLKPSNVLGTQEVIRLAAHGKLKPLHYTSTVGVYPVAGHPGNQTYYEGDPVNQTDGLSSGYAHSKWVAEKLVKQAAERGLPVGIYRVGEVIGHSKTGICRPDKDAYSQMIRGAVLLKSAPKLNINLYLVPVDYVADSIFYLSNQIKPEGQCYHLTGEPIFGEDTLKVMQELGYTFEILPYPEWLNRLESQVQQLGRNPLTGLMPFLKNPLIMDLAQTQSRLELDTTFTRAQLKAGPSPLPPVRDLLKVYINYLKATGFLILD